MVGSSESDRKTPHIEPKTTDVVYATSPVFTRLSQANAEKFSGNSQIRRPIIVGMLNGGVIGRGGTVPVNFVVTDAALTAIMKVYWVGITLYGYDAMNNDGPEAIFNQVEMKFLNASLKMAQLLATDMYLNGQSSTGRALNLNGFSEWYDDGNLFPQVGGQNRTDINGQVTGTPGGLNAFTATLTSVTLQAINTAYGNACWGPDHPDIIACTQNGWNYIWNGLQPSQRYANVENDLGNIGFTNFRFNAADVVIDRYMPTGTNGVMFGINSAYVEWYFSNVPLFQFGWTGFKGANNSLDVTGQYVVGNNILVPNPRTGFKLLSTLF